MSIEEIVVDTTPTRTAYVLNPDQVEQVRQIAREEIVREEIINIIKGLVNGVARGRP